jgi:hypothetical protein
MSVYPTNTSKQPSHNRGEPEEGLNMAALPFPLAVACISGEALPVFSPPPDITGERGGVALGRLTTKEEGGGEKSVPEPDRWTLKLDGGGTEARGISS